MNITIICLASFVVIALLVALYHVIKLVIGFIRLGPSSPFTKHDFDIDDQIVDEIKATRYQGCDVRIAHLQKQISEYRQEGVREIVRMLEEEKEELEMMQKTFGDMQ